MTKHVGKTNLILTSIATGSLLSLILGSCLLFYTPESFDKRAWDLWVHWFAPLDLLQDAPALSPITEPRYRHSPHDGERRALVSMQYQTQVSAHTILNQYTRYFTHLGCDLKPTAEATFYWDTDTRLAGDCPDARYLQIALEQQPTGIQVRLHLNPAD